MTDKNELLSPAPRPGALVASQSNAPLSAFYATAPINNGGSPQFPMANASGSSLAQPLIGLHRDPSGLPPVLSTIASRELENNRQPLSKYWLVVICCLAFAYGLLPAILNGRFARTVWGDDALGARIFLFLSGLAAYASMSFMTFYDMKGRRDYITENAEVKSLLQPSSWRSKMKAVGHGVFTVVASGGTFYITHETLGPMISNEKVVLSLSILTTVGLACPVLYTYSRDAARRMLDEIGFVKYKTGKRSIGAKRAFVADYCRRAVLLPSEEVGALRSQLLQEGKTFPELCNLPYKIEDSQHVSQYPLLIIGRFLGVGVACINYDLGRGFMRLVRDWLDMEETIVTKILGGMFGVAATAGWGFVMTMAAGDALKVLANLARYHLGFSSSLVNPDEVTLKKVAGIVLSVSGAIIANTSRAEIIMNMLEIILALKIILIVLSLTVPSAVYSLTLRQFLAVLFEAIFGPDNSHVVKNIRLFSGLVRFVIPDLKNEFVEQLHAEIVARANQRSQSQEGDQVTAQAMATSGLTMFSTSADNSSREGRRMSSPTSDNLIEVVGEAVGDTGQISPVPTRCSFLSCC